MKNGTCPECNSPEVYYTTGEDGQGLRSEDNIYLRVKGLNDLDLETYVCAECGYVRSFIASEILADIVAGIGKSKLWKKAT